MTYTETTMISMSLELRSELRFQLNKVEREALSDHIYDKNLGYFDPRADWQITDILELSELAHRLRDIAEGMDSIKPLKIELMRLAKIICDDFDNVYQVAMKRMAPRADYTDYRTTGTMA